MPKQLSNSRFLKSKEHIPPSNNKDDSNNNNNTFRRYSSRHNMLKNKTQTRHILTHQATHHLIERAYHSKRYEDMVRLNRLSLKRWLGHSEYVGHRPTYLKDYQHILISSSWPKLIFIVTFFTAIFVMFFSILFVYVEPNIVGDNFWNAWNLSIQTFLTIGYGSIAPETDLGNILVYFEVTLSTAICAIFTGLVFLKFSKAKAPILFANKAVVTNNSNGEPILKIRCCLSRAGALLLLPQYEMNLIMVEESYEGGRMIRLRKLELERSEGVVLNANFNLVHDLTSESPLRKHWTTLYNAHKNNIEITPAKLSFALLISIEGVEMTFQTSVFHQHFIYPHDLEFDAEYGDMISMNANDPGHPTMEVLKLFDLIASKYPLTDPDIKSIPGIIKNSHHNHTKETPSIKQRLSIEEEIKQEEDDENALLQVLGSASIDDSTDNNNNNNNNGKMKKKKIAEVKNKQIEKSNIASSFCCCSKNIETYSSHDSHTVNIISGSCTEIMCHCSTYYWSSLRSSIGMVFCLMFLLYTALTLIFALFIMIDQENPFVFDTVASIDANNCTVSNQIRSTKPIEFSTAFYFATQTLSSVGYGVLSPSTDYSHVIVTVLGFAGFLIISAISGIIWSRFAKPDIPLRFSNNLVVTNWNGERVLMIRLAGLFPSRPIMKLALTGNVVLKKPGFNYFKSYPLKFVRDTNPIFKLPGTWMHVIDSSSPMYHVREKSLLTKDPIFLTFAAEGYDTAFETSVYKAASYTKHDLRYDYHFKDVILFNNTKIHVHMEHFDTLHRDACSFATYFLVKSYFSRERKRIRSKNGRSIKIGNKEKKVTPGSTTKKNSRTALEINSVNDVNVGV